MMSFRPAALPCAVTRRVLPTPAPLSTNMPACLPIHFCQSPCICVSADFLFSGSVFFQSSITEAGARYVTRNRFIGMLPPHPGVLACDVAHGQCGSGMPVLHSPRRVGKGAPNHARLLPGLARRAHEPPPNAWAKPLAMQRKWRCLQRGFAHRGNAI